MKKEKFVVEYNLKSVSLPLLWTYIGTVNGLADWFADDVKSDGKIFTFYWNKTPQQAQQTAIRAGNYIRFRWMEDDPNEKTFFELRIAASELTNDTVLSITDFDAAEDISDSKELWDHQVDSLRRKLGV